MSWFGSSLLALNRAGAVTAGKRFELGVKLPSVLDRLLFGERHIVKVESVGEEFSIQLFRSPQAITPRGSATLVENRSAPRLWRNYARKLPVVLGIPPEQVLRKEVDLPDGAAKALRSAIDFNLSQWTPFRPDEVYSTGKVTGKSGDRNHAEIRIVPKPVVEQLIARLQPLGLEPDAIALDRGQSDLVWLRERKRRRRLWENIVDLALILTIFGLLSAIAALHYQNATSEIESLKNELRAEIQLRTKADEISREIAHLRARHEFLGERRSEQGDLVNALDYARGIVPQTAQIDELDWTPAQLRLVLSAPPLDANAPESDPWPQALASKEFRPAGVGDNGWPRREWIVPPNEWVSQ